MKTWALLSFTASGIGLLLCGCGGGSAPASPKSSANALAGNWLLVGPMPTNQVNPTGGLRLAMTFDVTGNNVVAVGFGNNSCNNIVPGFEFGTVLAGTVAADGSFTLATPANDPFEETISIKGMVPQASGGPWPGSYAVSLTSTLSPSCDANLSGTFIATSFPLISGVYVGTGTMQTIANGPSTSTPVTFQVSLQQGGTLTNPVNGAASPLSSNAVLNGSIRVQGSPCFNSGATAVTPASSVEGSMVNAAFLMDDGSTLDLLGSLTDILEGHIGTGVVLVTGGKCGTSSYFFQLPGLDRQS